MIRKQTVAICVLIVVSMCATQQVLQATTAPQYDNIHIRVLRSIHNTPGMTIEQIERDIGVTNGTLAWLSEEFHSGGRTTLRVGQKKGEGHLLVLSMNGRAILLQHDQLQEARASSRNAMILAICALVVTIIVGLAQIILARKQQHSPNRHSTEERVSQDQKSEKPIAEQSPGGDSLKAAP